MTTVGMRPFQRPMDRVQWRGGPVSDAVDASCRGRVLQFVTDGESEAVQLFSEASRAVSTSGDWYGEHAGKWLVAASRALRRTQDEALRVSLERVLGALLEHQERDGYLGTYAPNATCRMTHPDVAGTRSWDPWVHAWMILGLLATHREIGDPRALEAATRIGDLFLGLFGASPGSLLKIGNHQGLSSAVVIEPLARLSLATGEPRFAEFARRLVDAMESAGLPVLSGPAAGMDAASIGTGKSYQLCWVFTGLAALYRAMADTECLKAARWWWENVAARHLTPLGGPWGGVATHKEVFNAPGFFTPEGLTETCSTASWMALSRELFELTGDARYADAFDRSLHNALLGALDANGADWCYFTFPNGRRNNTYHWACCKSSGAMALEEGASMAATVDDGLVCVNLLDSFEAKGLVCGAEFEMSAATTWGERWRTEIAVDMAAPMEFELAVRAPAWLEKPVLAVADASDTPTRMDQGYLRLRRVWRPGDRVVLGGETPLRVVGTVQSVEHHGQEIVRNDFAHVVVGPYVYATGLVDGYRKQDTLRLSHLFPASSFRLEADGEGCPPNALYCQPGRAPVVFEPYFRAGGRHDGAWRATWLGVAWQ